MAIAACVANSTAVAAQCTGDCDQSGDVTVDEIIAMVNIALGSAAPSTCLPGDADSSGDITINEIVAAVNNALAVCPPPIVTPTPTLGRFVDNGDGTITDNQTGLVWEKKAAVDSAPGGLHDVGTIYPGAGFCSSTAKYCQPTAEAAAACVADVDGDASGCAECKGGVCATGATTIWQWVAQLNSGAGFAGHTDWRVPKLSELEAINDGANYNFVVGNGVFNRTGCKMRCADITSPACSCTGEGNFYWSATTFSNTDGWLISAGLPVEYHNGLVAAGFVRAVRGGR